MKYIFFVVLSLNHVFLYTMEGLAEPEYIFPVIVAELCKSLLSVGEDRYMKTSYLQKGFGFLFLDSTDAFIRYVGIMKVLSLLCQTNKDIRQSTHEKYITTIESCAKMMNEIECAPSLFNTLHTAVYNRPSHKIYDVSLENVDAYIWFMYEILSVYTLTSEQASYALYEIVDKISYRTDVRSGTKNLPENRFSALYIPKYRKIVKTDRDLLNCFPPDEIGEQSIIYIVTLLKRILFFNKGCFQLELDHIRSIYEYNRLISYKSKNPQACFPLFSPGLVEAARRNNVIIEHCGSGKIADYYCIKNG